MRALCICALLLVGCAHGVANEDRLDADARDDAANDELAQGLLRLDWRTASGELTQARDDSLSEGKRFAAYQRAVIVLKAMSDRYALELQRNPDLAYSQRGPELELAQRRCADQLTLVKRERSRFAAAMAHPGEPELQPAPRPMPARAAPTRVAHHFTPKKPHWAKSAPKSHRHVTLARAG